MSDAIDISGIPKPRALAALYNASKQQGMGFIHQRGAEPMTEEQAAEEFEHGDYFDYLHGRVMKVDLSGDELDPYLYDRDNGQGAAARAISAIADE